MYIFLILFFLGIIILIYKYRRFKKSRIKNLDKFKNKFLSKEFNIEKIFLREDEKKSSNPHININIGIYEKEEDIKRKTNIHRARLSKFKKSKLNGDMLFLDEKQKLFKYYKGNKKYL
tara:strand:+ start:804 stop:1157 length:354 start_codon:yes stop_codon:yes gene_type:complete